MLCLVVGCSKVSRDNAEIKKAAKAQADEIETALVKGDFARKLPDRTHPKVIEKILAGRIAMVCADDAKARRR